MEETALSGETGDSERVVFIKVEGKRRRTQGVEQRNSCKKQRLQEVKDHHYRCCLWLWRKRKVRLAVGGGGDGGGVGVGVGEGGSEISEKIKGRDEIWKKVVEIRVRKRSCDVHGSMQFTGRKSINLLIWFKTVAGNTYFCVLETGITFHFLFPLFVLAIPKENELRVRDPSNKSLLLSLMLSSQFSWICTSVIQLLQLHRMPRYPKIASDTI
ncbi:hypothetical protein Ahy_A03g016081 isoform B [Arachis hypogaea]|uniref:Uncharacterized protein n=1 Tax=Arachis hypogaea TaxID=3818 RepID=A0A445E272_ARAHY|nr:hypothetical protein Ahy_A03g016081 isoform B [Arachis hypogaea]